MESEPLDVWLRHIGDEEEAEAEANTYRTDHGYRVDWYLTSVGLVRSHTFTTYDEACAWLSLKGFEDYTS